MLSTTRVVKQQMKWKFMIRKQIVRVGFFFAERTDHATASAYNSK